MSRDELALLALRIATRTALAYTRDITLAEDVGQDTAVEVLRRYDSLRDPDSASAWIHRIAVNKTLSLLRRERRRVERERESTVTGMASATPGASPEEVAEQNDLRRQMVALLAELPENQRMAVVLRHVHDLSHEQIASAMSARPGTVAAWLSRAHARLGTRAAGGL